MTGPCDLESSRPSIAIATCRSVVEADEDDLQLIDELARHGVPARHVAWDDDEVDWSSFSLVVIRSTWDYPDRREQFLARVARYPRVLNPYPVLSWNTDKRYLDDLARGGLPVIPTRFLEPGELFEPPDRPFVVKPAVSCGAKQTARYAVSDGALARAHVARLHTGGRTVMVQPYLENIEANGEAALVFIAGEYSHSIRRGALLQHRGVIHEGELVPPNILQYDPSAEERTLAEQALEQITQMWSPLLYARVDLAPGPAGKPLILEVELTEPSLFLGYSPGSAGRLAQGIVATLVGN